MSRPVAWSKCNFIANSAEVSDQHETESRKRDQQDQYEQHDDGEIVWSILMLIVAATMYSRMLGISGLPNELGEWISGSDIGLYGILTVYVIVLIILGTILDTTSIILIMVPLFLPVLAPFNIDLVWFGSRRVPWPGGATAVIGLRPAPTSPGTGG